VPGADGMVTFAVLSRPEPWRIRLCGAFPALRRSELARVMRLPSLGISARSAATSAVVVLVALAFAGAAFDLILYRSLLAGVDDATAGRVRTIVDALHSDSPDDLDSALLATNQRVVAIQLIVPDAGW